ncbi:MAG: TadE/TadG family type IV pilus assembly protein [Hyphomicrobiales bacterium]
MFKPILHKKKINSFAKDDRGSFAILFGLLAAIAIFAAGAGIDYTLAINEQNRIQKAVDAAVLSGAAQSQNLLTDNEIEQAALEAFNINYQASQGATISPPPQFNYNPTTRQLIGTVTGNVETTLTKVLGFQRIDIRADATAQLGIVQVEYVLAIDQSGSMRSNGRQDALEDGLQTFSNVLANTLRFGDEAYIGVVPWQTTVNIGPQRRSAVFGLDRPKTSGLITPLNNNAGDPNNLEFTASTQRDNVLLALSSFDFNAQGFSGYDSNTTLAELDTTTFIGPTQGSPNINPSDYPDLSWRGCVMARDVDATFDINPNQNMADYADTEASANLAAPQDVLRTPDSDDDKFRAFYQPPGWGTNGLVNNWLPFGNHSETQDSSTRNPNLGCIRQEMSYFQSLSSGSSNVLSATIAGLDPDDDVSAHTDSSLGMLWALRMLDPAWRSFWDDPSLPVDVPAPLTTTEPVRKVIILLTDGRNGIGSNTLPETRSAYGDASETLDSSLTVNNGTTRNRATDILNLRTLQLCQLAKNKGIEVYTIGLDLNSGNSNIQESVDMLDHCASEPNAIVPDYSILATPTNLEAAFASIARQDAQVLLTE